MYSDGTEKHQVKRGEPGFAAAGLLRAFHVLNAMGRPRKGMCDAGFLPNLGPPEPYSWSSGLMLRGVLRETRLHGAVSVSTPSRRGNCLLLSEK